MFEAGTKAYVNFVSSLLSITDNLDGDAVIPPNDLIRRDKDDPYFVVAADKGTATFSDTANAISQKFGFWLDDAFASGGSAGYDHKKMGITARGAWEAVKRHFREMNRDIQTSPFTVVGVGDMSGDVFGNGMLLSEQTKLIAAFDHRDIFIDPDPDMAASMAERRRMFALPRSSWQDYDKSKLSKGGVIVARSQKSVVLPAEAAAAIGLAKTTASPTEIMNAILQAPADLLWFGGIGTYVRASGESNQEVGDRANDAIRVTAGEVRAKVIGEGANLGVTQRGRIEFGLRGGACNSDAIDNSGGVNSSDVEVNIKIALASAMRNGRLTRPARNKFLAEMTEEVGHLVLANNYQQTLALSLLRRRGLADLPYQARFMTALEARGLLDRAVETLPGPLALAEREARGEPLTRAELGVLLAYAKIVLFSDIVSSNVPDEQHFERDLLDYFPARMAKKYAAEIGSHRLRREIVARVVANDLVNRGGPAFVSRLQDLTGRSAADVVRAFTIARDGYGLTHLYAEIDALDNQHGWPEAARALCGGRPSRRCGHRVVPEEPRRDADRRAHRLAEAGAAGAGAEAWLAVAGLHARQDGGAHPRLFQDRRAGEARRAAGAARRGRTHSRHRDRRKAGQGAISSRRPRRSSPSPNPSASRASRKPCARSRSPTTMTGLPCRAPPTRSAAPAGALRSQRFRHSRVPTSRSAHGWRRAAIGSPRRANACRR